MDRRAQQAMVHEVAESDTTEHTHYTVYVIQKHYQCRIPAAIQDTHLN